MNFSGTKFLHWCNQKRDQKQTISHFFLFFAKIKTVKLLLKITSLCGVEMQKGSTAGR
jgi:hypothetical protein